MKAGDKEFYEMMYQFEKDIKTVTYGHEIIRSNREKNQPGCFYDDGYINTLFRAYMLGYEYKNALTI